MENAIKVAEYTLWYCKHKLGKPISNLQLQKFLYYEQGIHLALEKKVLFDNEIQAWKYGVVVPDVFYWFNSSILKASDKEENYDLIKCSKNVQNIVEFVVNELIIYSPWDLVEKTCQETPWENSYIRGFNQQINVDEIKKYFEETYLERGGN